MLFGLMGHTLDIIRSNGSHARYYSFSWVARYILFVLIGRAIDIILSHGSRIKYYYSSSRVEP